MKFLKKFKFLLPILLIFAFAFSFAACDNKTPDSGNGGNENNEGFASEAANKKVSAIEMATEPTKTEYFVGEQFQIAGASVKVTYEDNTEDTLALPSKGITVSNPTMTSAGSKTVTVTPEQRTGSRVRTTFRIEVRVEGFDFTYNYNYDGAQNVTENVPKDNTVRRPAQNPTRAGHTFYDWYADAACTVKYDFSTPVTAATTIYAAWKENGATYYEFTYDMNYYGVAPQKHVQIVKSGETAKTLGITAERSEFTFNGWYTNAGATTQFTATTAITTDTTVYAGWTKTKTGSTEYIFEAEHTDVREIVSPSYSGNYVGRDIVINDNTDTASGGQYVAGLFRNGLALDFYIASNEAATATLKVRIAEKEFSKPLELTDQTWQIRIYHEDGCTSYTTVNYGSYTVSGGNFVDAITAEIQLSEGYNRIQLITCNNVNPNGAGNGTYAGTSPAIDCIKLTTTAVLAWDETKGLPDKG